MSKEIDLLQEIWKHFDSIGDGAPDSSYAAKMALNFAEPLERAIAKLRERDAALREAQWALKQLVPEPRSLVTAAKYGGTIYDAIAEIDAALRAG